MSILFVERFSIDESVVPGGADHIPSYVPPDRRLAWPGCCLCLSTALESESMMPW